MLVPWPVMRVNHPSSSSLLYGRRRAYTRAPPVDEVLKGALCVVWVPACLCGGSGPHTGLGHNSVLFMMEAQADYIVDILTQARQAGPIA